MSTEQHERNLLRLQWFRNWIQKYDDLWKSMRINSAICDVDGKWTNLATSVILSELPVSKRRIVVRPMPEFCAYSISFPISELPYVLESIVANSRIPDLLISKAKAKEIHLDDLAQWPEPQCHSRRHEYLKLGRYCLAMQFESNGSQNLLSNEFLSRLDSRLGLKEPAYDGLADLYKKLFPHMVFDPFRLRSRADIFAPLPLTLFCADDGSVVLSAPESSFSYKLGIRFFFRPEGKSVFIRFNHLAQLNKGRAGNAEWRVQVKWPGGSEHGRAVLYFDEEKLDDVEISRWKDAINSRLAVNTYFDPGHERLKADLRLRNPKAARPFEIAVIKILNILGVNAIWYGDEENRSDGAAVYDVIEGKSSIYLIECTIQKARAKFSLIRERAKRLKDVVREAEIFPVVFVATDGEGDLQEASELGITLVDSRSIESLIGFLETNTDPQSVNQLFTALRTNFPTKFRFR